MALHSVRRCGRTLVHFTNALRRDQDVVREAVLCTPTSIFFAIHVTQELLTLAIDLDRSVVKHIRQRYYETVDFHIRETTFSVALMLFHTQKPRWWDRPGPQQTRILLRRLFVIEDVVERIANMLQPC